MIDNMNEEAGKIEEVGRFMAGVVLVVILVLFGVFVYFIS